MNTYKYFYLSKMKKSIFLTLKQINWPTYKQNKIDTAVVVNTSILIAISLASLDIMLSIIINRL